jgi:circadian clock protein KaiC
VVVTSEATAESGDDDLRFIVDGVIEMSFAGRGRELLVSKFRGSGYRTGRHALTLGGCGASVFPRLVPESHRRTFRPDPLSSGLPMLDDLLHGGIERGTVTLISGPTGVGKTTLGMQFLSEGAARGERCVLYTFDERAETVMNRCTSIGMPIREMLDRGTLQIVEVEALRFGPDEFASTVRRDIELRGTQIVMIDSVSGYRMSVSDDLSERIHALGRYLQNIGVTVLLVDELHELTRFRVTEVGISYLADNVLFLRYIEQSVNGAVALHKGIGVLKKRLSDFEKTVREFSITAGGITIGQPLRLSSILAHLPVDEHDHARGCRAAQARA